MSRPVFVIALLAISTFAMGSRVARGADIAGSSDSPVLPERFVGAEIEKYEAKPFDAYHLLTGPLVRDVGIRKKVGEGIPLEGRLTRIIYRIPKGPSTLQVVRNYELLLERQGFAPIFTISDSETPRKHDANDIVEMLQERSQSLHWFMRHVDDRYLAAKRTTPEGDAYVSLAVAQSKSGDPKRKDTVVVLLEIIEVQPMTATLVKVDAAAMQKDITETGRVALYGIYFDFDKADVKPESDETLGEIAKLLGNDPQLALFVVGHTDGKGAPDYNQGLSERRAQAVAQVLVSRFGIAASRLHAAGVGMYAPVAPNTTEEGRAKNRRVELVQQIR
jgi:outer membrane protein OmpA-like peptidoglycan-associated protein